MACLMRLLELARSRFDGSDNRFFHGRRDFAPVQGRECRLSIIDVGVAKAIGCRLTSSAALLLLLEI